MMIKILILFTIILFFFTGSVNGETIELTIVSNTDDCNEWSSNGFSTTSSPMTLGSTGNNNWYDAGLRWQDVTIPKNATINSAVLSIYVSYDYDSLQTIIKGVDEDNTATWSSGSKPSGRSKTSASVNGNEGNWGNWGVGKWVTIDVSPIISEITSRGGWVSGNALGIVIEDTAGATHAVIQFSAYSSGAKLDIDYTPVYVPPVVTLLSQTPSAICQNCSGNISMVYGVVHDTSGLNNTSLSFIFRNFDQDLSDSNHSIRPPCNDLASEWSFDGKILRGANRNETPGLNFEGNATITGGDPYTWSGLDENNTEINIVPVNDTYTLIYINGTIHQLMPQMWYIDRTDMIEAEKTTIAIHKTQNVLVKFWDYEIFKGNTDFLGVGYTDTALNANPALWPTDTNPVNVYYVSSGYDPATGGDPLVSGYAVYMLSMNASEWVDHVYNPHANASYVRGFIDNNLLESYINTTEISYLYYTSNTPSSKGFMINVTDVATSSNVSFANTSVMWAGDTTLSQQYATPNIWFAFMKNNMTFDHKLYVADNNGKWNNSTMSSTVVGAGLFPPTRPTFHSFHNGFEDTDMNGTYHGTFIIQIGAGSDPDGGNVIHNISTHYGNGTYIESIFNTTCNATCLFMNISFDSTGYLTSENYTLKVIATDDESESVTTWLGVNFTINLDNFSFINSGISPSAIRENEPFTISVDINDSDGTITTAIVKINYNNYTMTSVGGDTWAYYFTGTSVATRYYIEEFYAQDDFGAWNSTSSSLYIDAVSSIGHGTSSGITPVVTPTAVPTEIPVIEVEEEVTDIITNVSRIIERLISNDKLMLFRININTNSQIYAKEFYKEDALSCDSSSELVKGCEVENGTGSVSIFFNPDKESLIYNEFTYINIYDETNGYYTDINIIVINLMASIHFDTEIENPSTLLFSVEDGMMNGVRIWWIFGILVIGIIFYARKKYD